jgi:hypothetical protein
MRGLLLHGRVEVTTSASPDAVWAIVSDPTRVGEWSHECHGATWIDGATAAVPGARFRGTNKHGRARWTRTNEVLTVDAPRTLSWRTIPATLYPDSTIWTLTAEPIDGGTRITQTYEVVKLNRVLSRLYVLIIPDHLDRSEALTGDLRALAALAEHSEQAPQSR